MHQVLYVDDEPDLLDLGKIFLEMTGDLAVVTALSAGAALEIMKEHRFDAIVSDFQMPGMDGIVFLKKIRSGGDTTPFILFTGKGREEIVIEALNSGADFYLQKGGDPSAQFTELHHKILQAAQNRMAATELARKNEELREANQKIRTAEEKLWAHIAALTESRQRMNDHEQRLTEIINFLPDATFAITADGIVLVWNRAMEEMTGIPADRMVGRGDYEYSLPFYGCRRPLLVDLVLHFDEETSRKYEHFIREGDRFCAQVTIPHLYGGRGAHLWFEATPLYDSAGFATGAIETIRDISAIQGVQLALQSCEEKYRQITEHTSDGVLVVRNGVIRYANFSLREMLGGYAAGELMEHPLSELIHPEDREAVVTRVMQQREPALPEQAVAFRAITHDTGTCHLQGRLIPITWENSPAFLLFLTGARH